MESWAELNYTSASPFLLNALPFLENLLPCDAPSLPQHAMFQMANALFLVSYICPSGRRGLFVLHSVLVVAYLLYSAWAWNVMCASYPFTWAFIFSLLNLFQTLHVLYQLRPVELSRDVDDVYAKLFQPLSVPRVVFKRLVSPEYAQLMDLHTGEAYALSNITKTDRLGLLVSGKMHVMSERQFLHSIQPMEFLDSPEFESSRTTVEETFKVSVVAATSCRYLFWQRSSLEYFFVKEPFVATVMGFLIARDITRKLYAMNGKIMTDQGSHLDIRLPSLTSSLSSPEAVKGCQVLRNGCLRRESDDVSFGRRSRDGFGSDESLRLSLPLLRSGSSRQGHSPLAGFTSRR